MQLKFTNYKPHVLIPTIGVLWMMSSWGLSKLWGYGFFQGIGPVTIVAGFLTLYDRWLWKFPLLNWLNTIPNLNGVYKGSVSYHYDGKNDTKNCKLFIKQTCSHISVKSIFNKDEENETLSISTEAFIKIDEAGDHYLYFYYKNRGSCKSGDTLNQHDGMSVLEIQQSNNSVQFDGYYFTNRDPQTKGCLNVKQITKGDN